MIIQINTVLQCGEASKGVRNDEECTAKSEEREEKKKSKKKKEILLRKGYGGSAKRKKRFKEKCVRLSKELWMCSLWSRNLFALLAEFTHYVRGIHCLNLLRISDTFVILYGEKLGY